MKFIKDVSADKLRGGFYTPERLVLECYRRLGKIAGHRNSLHILEPSSGDGAFIRGAKIAISRGCLKAPTFTCVELIEEEACKCSNALEDNNLEGSVVNGSFFSWAKGRLPVFDALVGNPPFVRYQFVPKNQREDADILFANQGKSFDGVSNLWVPFFLISLELLREGGAFSCVLPSELFSTKSTGLVRSELIRHFDSLQVDFYQRGLFDGILQDTVLVSGVKSQIASSMRSVHFVEHNADGVRRWNHDIRDTKESWTRYLLTHNELDAFKAASRLDETHKLGEIATVGVSIVTGANNFFTVDSATLEEYDLQQWAKPLLARSVDSLGIVFRKSDHKNALNKNRKAWILDFNSELPDPIEFDKPRQYLAMGESEKLPSRYKCRIRTPWYRVPDVRHDDLMMSKRAHQFHRLILNKAKVNTTDTIYRGRMRPLFGKWQDSLAAAFHNSLTILSSEVEGRTYGGGVLELIPSEIGRLVVPLVEMRQHLNKLDKVCRDAGGQLDDQDTLIHATNELLCEALPGFSKLLPDLESAREHLRRRRFFG
jgi:adenine-specific DNA-methyltransferase